MNLEFHLRRFYAKDEIAIHFFDNFESLITTCQRYPIDLILMGGNTSLIREIELVRAIKENVFISIIPVVLYHPDPEDSLVIAAHEQGAEDFITGNWVDRLVEVRIRKVIERSRRDLAVNPSTRMPGPAIIEREINRLLERKEEFAVCYADLDNFKAYNDYYGYAFGDKVIRLTARIIKDTVFDLCRGGFVGHIAGDDFFFIIPPDLVDETCSAMIHTLDALMPYQYEEVDRDRGSITTKNRKGEVEIFPLLTISIAVLVNSGGEFHHVGEMSKMLADLKTVTKAKTGSNYMVERRAKY